MIFYFWIWCLQARFRVTWKVPFIEQTLPEEIPREGLLFTPPRPVFFRWRSHIQLSGHWPKHGLPLQWAFPPCVFPLVYPSKLRITYYPLLMKFRFWIRLAVVVRNLENRPSGNKVCSNLCVFTNGRYCCCFISFRLSRQYFACIATSCLIRVFTRGIRPLRSLPWRRGQPRRLLPHRPDRFHLPDLHNDQERMLYSLHPNSRAHPVLASGCSRV